MLIVILFKKCEINVYWKKNSKVFQRIIIKEEFKQFSLKKVKTSLAY